MSRLLRSALLASAISMLSAWPVHAQMSRTNLENLPMPQANAFVADVALTVNQVDVRTISNYATNWRTEATDDPQNAGYLRYTAPLNSVIGVTPSFSTPVPPPTATGDNCHHSHLEYAVYVKTMNWNGSQWLPSYSVDYERSGSAGELGRRMLNGTEVYDQTAGATCLITSAPDTKYPTLNSFNWGDTAMALTYHSFPYQKYTEMIVVVQAVQHGWGRCGLFTCFAPVDLRVVRYQ
jgi:hypothetical protein